MIDKILQGFGIAFVAIICCIALLIGTILLIPQIQNWLSDDAENDSYAVSEENGAAANGSNDENNAGEIADLPQSETSDAVEAPPPQQNPGQVQHEWENALQSGESHLRNAPFSSQGLASQLASDGYTEDAIEWAMSQLNNETDWSWQAVIAAERLLETSSLSASELIEQLISTGFSQTDAENAASRVLE